MSFSINTNIASLQAQNYLAQSSKFQSQTINEVTSGLRIVNSGDDAAGLAIANGYKSSETVLTQGIQNANDGLSTLQTIDGGMNNINTLLDRASTLATESASGTFTGDRSTLNAEFQSVIGEINRQAQSIGMNQGGQFAKQLSVFIGGGQGATSAAAIANGSINLDLSKSTVDAQSLGLQGVQATGNTSTDIGTGSANTSVQQILANTANDASQKTAGYTTFTLSGAGFSGSNSISLSVNLAGVTDANTLATAINAAIATAGNGTTQYATAFKNANISAAVVTNASGQSQLAFSSSQSAFQVQAGDQTANALLGNFAQNATLTGAGTNPTVDTSSSTAANRQLAFEFDGSSTAITVQIAQGSAADTIGDIVNQLNANSTFQKQGVASLQGNQIVVQSLTNGSTSAVAVTSSNALTTALFGSNTTASAASASTGAPLTTTVQSASGAVSTNPSIVGTVVPSTGTPVTLTAGSNTDFKLQVGTGTATNVSVAAGAYSSSAALATAINTAIAGTSGVAGLAQANVVDGKIVLSSTNGSALTITAGTNDGTTTMGLTGSSSTPTVQASDSDIQVRISGGNMGGPVTLNLNATTAGTTTVASVLADLQSKVASNSQLAAAGITLSSTGVGGGTIAFSDSQGQQFQVSVTGDSTNLLGFGAFAAGSGGAFDYSTVSGSGGALGTTTAQGTLNISLNGGASGTTANPTITVASGSTAAQTVTSINAQIAASSALSAAGLVASINTSTSALELTSTTGTTFRVSGGGPQNLGFGTNGGAYTGTTASAVPSTGKIDSAGAYSTGPMAFNSIVNGGDSQSVAITATDASGAAHSLSVTLQNNATSSNASNIDDAINAINTQLQQSNDSTLQSIVAVKENNPNGTSSINFESTTQNFKVAVSSLSDGSGITAPTGGIATAAQNGAGANVSIDTISGAESAVTALSAAVQGLGTAQAAIGKGENLLNYANSLAQSQLTNEAASESAIRDANLAQEAANLTKAQILMQAGTAALSQANSAPQQILSLLQGH